jgi:hypothetical protein
VVAVQLVLLLLLLVVVVVVVLLLLVGPGLSGRSCNAGSTEAVAAGSRRP